jgi:uncharacterized YkwD family protein/spore coat assembly protein SafA
MIFKKTIVAAVVSLILSVSVMAASTVYIVKSGDTAWKIATKYSVSVSDLQKANPQVKDFSKIYVGQKITIPSPNGMSALESQVITLVNKERVSRGLMALKTGSTLSYVARLKSQDMVNKGYFSHTSPTYGSPFNMMEHFGISFSAAGENIAYGQPTAASVMTAWMNSPGHRANILNPSYTYIGVGAAKNSRGVIYWTQEFIKPM